ncbi:Menaquinone via 6-amino-6-deoxyfutalosine step 1 [hydrothermal vent metagenome]|uniref:Menaquinone via 6-amino-6-deoxyfutalosine step 1 n=1 Tax=hydrothermal vent metagenome TaxID=652676 RepID=A0A1W1C3U9_9ZZZZ
MIFGSISYLNLLPFQLFLKKYLKQSATKMAFNYKRAVPSKINKALSSREINAGFISSVESPRYRCTDLGIIANRAVYSVFVIEGEEKKDRESASSNKLASILNLKGEVIIGDKALKYYLDGGVGIDLATAWYEKSSLPFVFARLCYNCYSDEIQKISKKFIAKPIKIPQYILKKEAKKRDITPKQLLWYLEHIEYKMDYKSKKSLKKFLREIKKSNLKNRK